MAFANECLGHLAYEPTAPAIALAALLVVFAVNFIAARYIAKQRQTLPRPGVSDAAEHGEKIAGSAPGSSALAAHETRVAIIEVEMLEGARTCLGPR